MKHLWKSIAFFAVLGTLGTVAFGGQELLNPELVVIMLSAVIVVALIVTVQALRR